ncbi:MAG: anthranilate synthase component I family protein [Phycisphaerae bacterium]|nr:anthranilate synthase component I family protein [Phycisphaerae bacterium]
MPHDPAFLDAFDLSPEAALRAWPADEPLASVWSGGDDPHARWVILARPGPTRQARSVGEALGLLQEILGSSSTAADAPLPFVGGWIGYLSYDLGPALEPAIEHHAYPSDRRLGPGAVDDRGWPPLAFQRCQSALVYDRAQRRWWGVGPEAPRLAERVRRGPPRERAPSPLGAPESDQEAAKDRYVAAAADAVDLIRAGDVYQVNLAHRLSWAFRGSPRALFASVVERARPWYGGFMELEGEHARRALCSASPELLFALDARSRRVIARPMKGTRPGSTDSRDLIASAKDRAELAMIVDLVRNDLGRVCGFGSVRVDRPRAIERHASGRVLQATATVSGELRPGRTAADLVRAAFPGGSVTGAPKIRAMRLIDRLEPVRRGPYCGSFGFVSDSGHAAFNILIRSALLSGRPTPDGLDGILDYSVGAGIVADSDPQAEWEETLVKARPFIDSLVPGSTLHVP